MIAFEGMEYRVKEYLNDIRRRLSDIEACRNRIDDIENQMAGIKGIQYKAEPANPNAYGDAIPDGLALLEEAHVKLYEEIALHYSEIDHAWQLCRPHVSENRYVLWLHHVQGMSWSKVARARCVSDRKVYEMRADGITELYEAMPEERRRDSGHKAID